MSFRRSLKNFLKNYSVAVIKVREATSNDPWGPSSSLMLEIADLTYHATSLSEIMSVLWKRLNDQGKKWRHVYKSLTLLDYIIKNGSEKVIHQCREGLFNIQTLKEFQYVDEAGRDQGFHVREKSRQVLVLLMDDALLNRERKTARRTRQRMLQTVNVNQISASNDQFLPLSSINTREDLPIAHCERANSPKPLTSEWEQSIPLTEGMRVVRAQTPEDNRKEACIQDLISFSDDKTALSSGKMVARSESCPPTSSATSFWNSTLMPPTAKMSSASSSNLSNSEALGQNMRILQMTSDDKIIMPVASTVYRPYFLAPNLASLRIGSFQAGLRSAGPMQFGMPGFSGMYSALPQFNTPVTAPFATLSMGTEIPMMAASQCYNPLSSSALPSSKNPFL